MVTIIKVRPDGTHKEFFCDTQEYAESKIKSNPEMFMTVEDFEKIKSEKKEKGRKKSKDSENEE